MTLPPDDDPLPVAERLRRLQPQPSNLDQRELFYRAGFAAAREVSRSSSLPSWKSALVAACLAAALVGPLSYQVGRMTVEAGASARVAASPDLDRASAQPSDPPPPPTLPRESAADRLPEKMPTGQHSSELMRDQAGHLGPAGKRDVAGALPAVSFDPFRGWLGLAWLSHNGIESPVAGSAESTTLAAYHARRAGPDGRWEMPESPTEFAPRRWGSHDGDSPDVLGSRDWLRFGGLESERPVGAIVQGSSFLMPRR